MVIFDDMERDHVGDPAHTESYFGYLNRSNRPEAERVRALLEDWISRFPESKHAGIVGRLRSQIDDAHLSAFFELALHELLLRTNHKILEIEPKLEHTNKQPDFLVEGAKGERFYLEAVMATGRSAVETAAQNRLNQAIEIIDRRDVRGHFLELEIRGTPTKPISLNKLREQLDAWIQSLPEGKRPDDDSSFRYEEHGVQIYVSAFPRHTKKEEKPARAVGVQSSGMFVSTAGEDLNKAIEGKASRYGKLDAPYVVAVNGIATGQNEENILDALLGSPYVEVVELPDGTHRSTERRNADGVWRGQKGPKHQALGAVIFFQQLRPWSVGQRRARLIRNPWADPVFPATGLQIDELNCVEGKLVKSSGLALREIIGLSEDWPVS